jgi:N-acyl homoserine lactone hydrolase
MSVRLFAFTCGRLTGDMSLFLPGQSGRVEVPVPSFLIEHPRGRVVFDTGLHPATQHEPEARLGPLAKIFEVRFGPGEELTSRLEALDLDPGRVDFLINSHLHFDHAGGNAQLPNARLVLQRREWDAACDADLRARNGFDPADFDLGQSLLTVDGEYDLFGDGRVVCIPTWGHTPGHQSLRVALDSGPVILTGDACYLRRTLEDLILPGVVHDAEAMLASLHHLRDLEQRGGRLIFGHDPELWATIPQGSAIS